MEDDLALRYVRIYPGVNSRAELVTLAPGVSAVGSGTNCLTTLIIIFLENAGESDLSDLLAELEILKKINKEPHPNVIRFIGGCSLEGNIHTCALKIDTHRNF